MKEMGKSEFLNKFNENVKTVTILEHENIGNLDELKEKMLPIVQKEFIDSVPKSVKRGNKIKIKCLGFELEGRGSKTYYININGESFKVGNWLNGVKVLAEEMVTELSTMINHEVKYTIEDDRLKFYFYC